MGLVVGLTGGIGSGKSAAAEQFAACGAGLVDVDVIAHQLSAAGGAAMPALAAAFGEAAVGADGALDRAAMRALVFADPAARARLEAILHPMIRAHSERSVRDAQEAGVPYVVLVVPLLVETGGYVERCTRVAVVDCPEALQRERVMRRSGLTEAAVLAIMAAQATREQRLLIADDVIDNSTSFAALQQQVARLDGFYRTLV